MKTYTMGVDYEQEKLIETMKAAYEEEIGRSVPTSKYLRKLLFFYIERDERLSRDWGGIIGGI